MKMLKKIGILALTLGLGAAFVPAVYAASIQGAVANVDATENGAIAGTVACRIYSVSGADAGINNNNAATCGNRRCIRTTYATNTLLQPGGYVCNQEDTASYNSNSPDQTFYNLLDAEAFAGTCNHVGLYALQGIGNTNIAPGTGCATCGDHRNANCSGTTVQNCLTRADDGNARTTPILNTKTTLGPSANQVINQGGLSPIPIPKVSRPGGGGCPGGAVRVTWDNPHDYAGAMKTGATTPLLGVRLWKSDRACSSCPGGDVAANGWISVGTFGPGAGTDGVCVPITGDAWFAMSVRVRGPSQAPTEIETGLVNGVGFVGANSQCVQLVQTAVLFQNSTAKYVGRASVNVEFTTGIESGVTSFYVRRAATAEGPFTRVGSEIGPTGDGTTYSATDKVNASMGKVLYYQIEAVMSDGTTQVSGVTGVALPAAQKKLGPDA